MAEAFLAAVGRGDLDALTTLLAEDAVMLSDGGGKMPAALQPILGRDKIIRFFIGVTRKLGAYRDAELRAERLNGLPGFIMSVPGGGVQTISFETDADKIQAIYIVRNPDKLAHLEAR